MGANKQRGELPLTVGDTTYVMKLTTNAVCEMETASGRTVEQVMANLQKGSLNDVRLFLWALLQAHHPGLTVHNVGDLIDEAGGVVGVKDQLEVVMKLNTGEQAERAGNPQTAQGDGTGVGSTSTLAASA